MLQFIIWEEREWNRKKTGRQVKRVSVEVLTETIPITARLNDRGRQD